MFLIIYVFGILTKVLFSLKESKVLPSTSFFQSSIESVLWAGTHQSSVFYKQSL